MNLTTQKVSHPPVRPKYGAFAPARAFLETAMARSVVYMKLKWGKRRDRTKQNNKYDLIECRRTSLSPCLRAGYPSTQATMVWSIDAANFVLPHHHHRLYLAPAVQRNMVTKYKVSGFVLDQVLGSTAILP